ncbi:MAG: transmembrane amino acid transporter protein-domain-containing protein [Monoraphidium minutum]|nr:MAG: transmembrane amino acid transporter protein-domain-containing protein [Monoraphidium minutum]
MQGRRRGRRAAPGQRAAMLREPLLRQQAAAGAAAVAAAPGDATPAASSDGGGLSPRVSVVIEDGEVRPNSGRSRFSSDGGGALFGGHAGGASGGGAHAGSGGGGGGGGGPDTFNIVVFNLSKVILGAGMMAMPRAMYILGLVPGTLLMLAICLLTQFTLAQGLIASADGLGIRSYGALVRRGLGARAEELLQLSVFATCWVMQVVFLVVVGDILIGDAPDYHGLIHELTGLSGGLAASRGLVLGALCFAVLLPLGSMRSMDRLAAVNIVGVASNGVLALLMLVLAATAAAGGRLAPLPLWPRWGALVDGSGGAVGAALTLASTMPIILNCFACHQSLFPLLPSLRPYTTARAQAAAGTSLAVAGGIYFVIATCSCAVFGGTLHDDVLADISVAAMTPLLGGAAPAHAAALVVRIGYLLSLTGSFVLLLFPARQVLAEVLLGGHDALAAAWLPATAALTASVYLTAVFLPSIWGALSLVGATAVTVQAWLAPALLVLASERAAAAARRRRRGGGKLARGGGAGEGLASVSFIQWSAAAAAAAGEEEGAAGGGGGGGDGGAPALGAAAAAAPGGGWRGAGRVSAASLIFVIGAFMFCNAILTPLLAAWGS